jgi:6,7-dimethyl-8-ribityllumazine synthase
MGRYDKIYEFEPKLDGTGLRVGIVMSRFNIDVSEGLLSACTSALLKMGVVASDIRIATVAGALEIPLVLKKMAESGNYNALVALGAVIRGETYHFEVVSNEMAAGIMRINLDTGIPIANGVLTTNTDHQATERMSDKGKEAAQCAVEMANLLKAI